MAGQVESSYLGEVRDISVGRVEFQVKSLDDNKGNKMQVDRCQKCAMFVQRKRVYFLTTTTKQENSGDGFVHIVTSPLVMQKTVRNYYLNLLNI